MAAEPAPREVRFERISLEEGLPQSTVTAIDQDRTGFVWVGTQDGLGRFDGLDFKVFRRRPNQREEGLDNDSILALLVERVSGDLWIGTQGGLSRWTKGTDSFHTYHPDPQDDRSLSHDTVRALLQDHRGRIWVGTDVGLDLYDPTIDGFRHFRIAERAGSDPTSVRVLYEDRQGRLWVGTSRNGLAHFDRHAESFTLFKHHPDDPESLIDNQVLTLLEDQAGDFWVGTLRGLDRFDRARGTFRHVLEGPRVRALLEDRERRLWIGTRSEGLYLREPNRRQLFAYRHDPANPNSLSNNDVMSLFEDRGGVLWVGTQSGGLNKWSPRTWSVLHVRPEVANGSGLTNKDVLAFAESAPGVLWIGTSGGGLHRLERDTGKLTVFHHDGSTSGSISSDLVTCLHFDHQGTLWAGTMGGGLNRFRGPSGTFEHFRADPEEAGSLRHDGVTVMLEDRRQQLWVATFGGGLHRYESNTETFTHYGHVSGNERSLSEDRILALAEDHGGYIWVGTSNGGLNRFDPGSGTALRIRHDPRNADGLASDTIYSLHVDSLGDLWVGAQTGLHRLVDLSGSEAARFDVYLEEDGLPNDVINGIQSDGHGRLWLSTNNGLSRFDPRSGEFINFHTIHGIQSPEFHVGSHFKSATGELFFGGVNGFNAFYPEDLKRSTYRPPVVLVAFKDSKSNLPARLGAPVFDLREIDLRHDEASFSVEFAALDYTSPKSNLYRYKLEGFHDDWVFNGKRREASFHPGAGSYRLRVQGTNSDGVWSDAEATLSLHVRPPPWLSWWAYLLYAVLSIALVVSYFRIQNRRSAHQEELRRAKDAAETASRAKDQFLANMSHELRTPMNGVIGMTSLLLQMPSSDKQRQYLETIQVSGEALMAIVNDILDFSKIESERLEIESVAFDLRGCVEDALDVTAPSATSKGLKLGYWIESGAPEGLVGDPARTRQIIINLLSNAVKFTDSGEVTIQVDARQLEADPGGGGLWETHFAVRDTGIGIPTDQLDRLLEPFTQVDASITRRYGGTGLGLAICKRLAELMGGRIWAESREGEGSAFHFTIRTRATDDRDRSYLYRSHPLLQGRHALLIDASSTTLGYLRRYLGTWGVALEIAGSVSEAFEALHRDPAFDVLIADWEISTLDGHRWIEELTARCRDLRIPVITSTEIGRDAEIGGVEVADVLTKPLKPTRLHEALLQHIAGMAKPTLSRRAAGSWSRPTTTGRERELRILLAEDNSVNQEVALHLLSHLGYEARAVGNGREAVHAFERDAFDVVLMDLQMPEMDGFEATRRIRRRATAMARPYIIAMTAHAMFDDRERCLDAGMDDYLSKPIQIDRLQAALEKAHLTAKL